ncbi:MAG TPA: SGNH family hydrolase [Microvirga sp.]|nr:SGNH family hydrolase [Microvirga sp.]
MRSMLILRSLFLILLFIAGGGASALAQPGYYYQQRQQYGNAPPPGYRDPRAYPPGYYPGKLVQPAQPQQGFSFRRFFGVPDEPPPPARKPVAKPRRAAPPPAAVANPAKPKVNPTTHVVVFGDMLGDLAGQGLDDNLSDEPDIAVVRKTKAEAGLARGEADEWPTFIRETLDSGQNATLAVVMLGANDRQSIKEGEASVELLSDRWKELYRQRVDGVLRTFQERGIPVVWIGLPPVKNSKTSEDLVAMNEIYRESVERHGGVYVDVWPGFVDEENRYTATGPDVDGELARLRTNDGVLFTKAGARKLAHFADKDIKSIIGSRRAGTPIATQPRPADGSPEGGQPGSIEAAIPAPPDPASPVSLPSKPLVGPVLPLTRPDVAPGGTLVSGSPKLSGDHSYLAQRAFRAGIPPSSRPGRADDFRWPSP